MVQLSKTHTNKYVALSKKQTAFKAEIKKREAEALKQAETIKKDQDENTKIENAFGILNSGDRDAIKAFFTAAPDKKIGKMSRQNFEIIINKAREAGILNNDNDRYKCRDGKNESFFFWNPEKKNGTLEKPNDYQSTDTKLDLTSVIFGRLLGYKVGDRLSADKAWLKERNTECIKSENEILSDSEILKLKSAVANIYGLGTSNKITPDSQLFKTIKETSGIQPFTMGDSWSVFSPYTDLTEKESRYVFKDDYLDSIFTQNGN